MTFYTEEKNQNILISFIKLLSYLIEIMLTLVTSMNTVNYLVFLSLHINI